MRPEAASSAERSQHTPGESTTASAARSSSVRSPRRGREACFLVCTYRVLPATKNTPVSILTHLQNVPTGWGAPNN